jgi:hypothetical protein
MIGPSKRFERIVRLLAAGESPDGHEAHRDKGRNWVAITIAKWGAPGVLPKVCPACHQEGCAAWGEP